MSILRHSLIELQAGIASTWFYHDAVKFWLQAAPTPNQIGMLERSCGSFYDRGGDIEPAWFNKKLVYFVDAKQPSPAFQETLLEIEATQPVHINHVQLARDECCTEKRVKWKLHEFRRSHEIRLWHQEHQEMHHDERSADTDYDAGAKAPRLLTRYEEQHSRHSGETDPLHSEFRINGVQSVRRSGIRTVR